MNKFFKSALGFLALTAVSANFTACGSKTSQTESSLTENQAEITESSSDIVENPVSEPISEKNTARNYDLLFSDRDMEQNIPDDNDIDGEILLKNTSAKSDSKGIQIDGSSITITEGGIYRISGTLDDGQIIVDAPSEKVQIILDGANITCGNAPAIYGVDSDKIFLSLAPNSVNFLTCNMSVSNDDSSPDACIFSSDSLTINGSGTLNITSTLDGIHSKDDIVITGGNLNIDSDGDGIKGKDYTAVSGGNFTINSKEDGIKSTNSNDASKGFVYIKGGKFEINSNQDGIQAETDLIIDGGVLNVITAGGYENSTKTHDDFNDFGGGRGGFKGGFGGKFGGDMEFPDNFGDFNGEMPSMPNDSNPPEIMQTTNSASTSDSDSSQISTKGLKGGNSIELNGGTVIVDSADDAIHSNGSVLINGGSSTLSAGDDGIHGDINVSVNDGTVEILQSYEGIESAVINVNGGLVKLRSADDGFNASDGTDQGVMGTYSGGVELNFNGGTVYVDADGDGLDSNGDFTINGGTILVNGPTNGGNGALDSNNKIIVNGGILVAAGSSQMAESPDEDSAQYSLSASLDSFQEAETLVTLCDDNGSEIICFAPSKIFDHIVISSPEIKNGQSYTLYLGGTSDSSQTYGLFDIGGYNSDGTSAGTFTAENFVSFIGQQSAMGDGFKRGDKKDFNFDGNGGNTPPDDKFDRNGDFQPPTDENGEPVMPDGGFKGDFSHGGRKFAE